METISLSDLELVENVKLLNCNDSLKTLIDRHTPLAHEIINRFSPRLQASGVPKDELISEKDFILYNAALSYNPNKKSKFSTWFANNVRYKCLNAINPNLNKQRFYEVQCGSEEIIGLIDGNISPEKYDIDFDWVMNLLDKQEDKRLAKIFRLRYVDNSLTWRQIGKELGLCAQTILNLHEKGIKIIFDEMKEND